MKATIRGTNRIVSLPSIDDRVRVWEGETEGGVRFVAYIGLIQVIDPKDDEALHQELESATTTTEDVNQAIALRHEVMQKCRGHQARKPSPDDYPPGWVTGETP